MSPTPNDISINALNYNPFAVLVTWNMFPGSRDCRATERGKTLWLENPCADPSMGQVQEVELGRWLLQALEQLGQGERDCTHCCFSKV
jgi:hypothetical protein